MELDPDVADLACALARSQVSSEDVFGAASLEPASAANIPPGASPNSGLGPEQQQLLREAYGRLLEGGVFRRVLDLTASSDSLAPPTAGLRLFGLASEPGRMAADPHLGPKAALGGARDLDDLEDQPHLPFRAPFRLPFDDGSFDAVLVTLEVGRLRHPLEVFRDVARVLRPQGLVAVSFEPTGHDAAYTRLWALADDREHLMLAEAFIELARVGFSPPTLLTLFAGDHCLDWQEGRSPEDTREPRVHLVFAYRDAVAPAHLARPPFPPPPPQPAKTKADIRFDEIGRPSCPYCGARMGRYEPPVTVFEIDYGVSELYVCFDDRCEYYRRSRRWMRAQGHAGFTYRFMLDPETGATGPLPDNLWGGLRSCRLD